MKIKLGVIERIHVLNILPAEGNVVTLRVMQALRKSVGFTEKELKEWKIVTEAGRVTWDEKVAVDIEVNFSDAMAGIVKLKLKELDKTEKLHPGLLTVYEKFIEGPEDKAEPEVKADDAK